eukprot:gene36644-49383_t
MPTVRDAAYAIFRHFGVDALFGNPGSTELPMLQAMPDEIAYVLGLNEAVVVAMADGYAQATRRAALVNLHSAAGTGNGLGSLFTAYRGCAVYCRFCFRREMVGPDGVRPLSPDALDAAMAYIAGRPEIWEVIVTGGDPLILSPRRLTELMQRLGAIGHVRIIRFHTRVPVVQPTRVDDGLVAALNASGKTVYVALHANHPREFTSEARAACARLIDAGIAMVSQSVLLRGVNDDAAILALAAESRPQSQIIAPMTGLVGKEWERTSWTSTQEQAWLTLAARALKDADQDIRVEVNDQVKKGGYETRMTGEELLTHPVNIVNTANDPVTAVITTVASPKDPLTAGGDGFDIFETAGQNAYDFGPGLETVVADYIANNSPYKPYTDGRIAEVASAAPAEAVPAEAAPAP